PSFSIWFHQHLDVVDHSSGRRAVERRFARAAGLCLATLTREPGSAVTWAGHCFPRATAFVVELPGGSLTGAGSGAVRGGRSSGRGSRPGIAGGRTRSRALLGFSLQLSEYRCAATHPLPVRERRRRW